MSSAPVLTPIELITRTKALLHASLPSPVVPAAALAPDQKPVRDAARPCALILSPHPDDECLAGGWPLRLRREAGWQIINVAVTLGSDRARRGERALELARACKVLGFDCFLPGAEGFSAVTMETRAKDVTAWRGMVQVIAGLIDDYRPAAIFLPHGRDGHPTHVGAHWLGMDALALQATDFSCAVVQTEWWQGMDALNAMVELGDAELEILLTALCCHAGEIARNPFHQRFLPTLAHNVRLGSERVGGKGAKGAAMDFAMLYRLDGWQTGGLHADTGAHMIGVTDKVWPD
jgi:LmbE family N-acetylglucosaminyl deacetylase